MKRHPLSQLFPELEGQDFRELVLDIKANGLHEEIVTLDGMVLDGWNRFRACSVAGIKPKLTQYIGTEPLAYVVSKNMARRHLTPQQRAEIAASIANSEHGGDRKNQGAHVHLDKIPNVDAGENNIITINQAAKMMGVSVRAVKTAKKLRAKNPELADQVRRGEVTLRAAAKKAGVIKDKQKPKRGRPPKQRPVTAAEAERGILTREMIIAESVKHMLTPQASEALKQAASTELRPLTAKQLKAECNRICAAVQDCDAESFAQLVNDWLVKPLVNRNQKRSVSPYTR